MAPKMNNPPRAAYTALPSAGSLFWLGTRVAGHSREIASLLRQRGTGVPDFFLQTIRNPFKLNGMVREGARLGGMGGALLEGLATAYSDVEKVRAGKLSATGAALDTAKGALIGASAAATGASVGAVAGSVVPVLGTAVGVIVGAGVGYLADLALHHAVDPATSGWIK